MTSGTSSDAAPDVQQHPSLEQPDAGRPQPNIGAATDSEAEALRTLELAQARMVRSPIEIARAEAEEVAGLVRLAARMLDELARQQRLGYDAILAHLPSALERVYEANKQVPGAGAYMLGFLLAQLAAPAILLQWAGVNYGLVGDILVFLATLALSLVPSAILLIVFVFQMIDISGDSPVLWSWLELEEPSIVERLRNDTRRARRRLPMIGIPVLLLTAAGFGYLRDHHSVGIDLVAIPLLTPVIATVIALASWIASSVSRPQEARISASLFPGDSAVMNLLNLAFYAARSRTRWDSQSTRGRLLRKIEEAARAAEYEFPGRDRAAVRGDAATVAWSQDQSARLAASFRRFKRDVLRANCPEHMDAVVRALCAALTSVASGDWESVTAAPPERRDTFRLRRMVAAVAPIVLLLAAAFSTPFIPGMAETPALRDTLRSSLLVAAVLALVTTVSPGSQRAADLIQSVLDKVSTASK